MRSIKHNLIYHTLTSIEIYSDIEMVKSKRIIEQVLSQYLVNIYPVLEKQIVVLRKPRLRNEVQPLGSVDSV